MRTDARPESAAAATTAVEGEWVVAHLRLLALALLATGQALPGADPESSGSFFVVLAAYAAVAAGVVAVVQFRPVPAPFGLAAAGADVAFVTALAALSGGAASPARYAYFLIPVAVSFRFRPAATAAAATFVLAADLTQGLAHAWGQGDTDRLLLQSGYLACVGAASIAGSWLMARRTRAVAALAEQRRVLLAEALTYEDRTRRRLSENLHDNAIQSMLAARHDLDEASSHVDHPALARADASIAAAVGDLREAIFELHPLVLEHAGLPSTLAAIARAAAERGHFAIAVDLDRAALCAPDRTLLAAARELLSNVVEHAEASNVLVTLARTGDAVELAVADDGRGFDVAQLMQRVANGHIGLAAHRARVEGAGGSLVIRSSPGNGSTITIRIPHPPLAG